MHAGDTGLLPPALLLHLVSRNCLVSTGGRGRISIPAWLSDTRGAYIVYREGGGCGDRVPRKRLVETDGPLMAGIMRRTMPAR